MKKNKQKNNICLIGFPRSRSSFFLECLSLHYNLPIDLSIQRLSDNLIRKNIVRSKYKVRFISLLRTLNNLDSNYVTRIHPYQLVANSEKYFDLSEIFDFDLFNFKEYKKIYVTKRNIVDRVCSVFIAKKTGTWAYIKDSEKKPLKNLEPCIINDNDKSIYLAVTEEIIFEKLEEYFKNNSIAYEIIDYTDVVIYAKKHDFPIDKVKYVETNYDYSTIISNYSEIKQYIENANLEIRKNLGLL